MAALVPRVVLVRRSSDYELLLGRHATRGQAKFFLETRGQDIDQVQDEHRRLGAAVEQVLKAVPGSWRRARVARDDLDRFLFEPEDIVVAVGQDGLVANVAKYLDGQLVIGVNPLPERFDGILVRHAPEDGCGLIAALERGAAVAVEERTMVEAKLDDGQRLVALNEIFVGQRTHQSARYRLRLGSTEERQSSSGMIVATGTGATGWARSINLARGNIVDMPHPTEGRVTFFVREAFPSVATGATLTLGCCDAGEHLSVVSEMDGGGVIFGDGIEDDFLSFDWGRTARIGVTGRCLRLAAVPAIEPTVGRREIERVVSSGGTTRAPGPPPGRPHS